MDGSFIDGVETDPTERYQARHAAPALRWRCIGLSQSPPALPMAIRKFIPFSHLSRA
jgi:hypothetical protein